VHGRYRFTLEHDLRLATTRLWAWREEDGSDAHWHTVIARPALADGRRRPLAAAHRAS